MKLGSSTGTVLVAFLAGGALVHCGTTAFETAVDAAPEASRSGDGSAGHDATAETGSSGTGTGSGSPSGSASGSGTSATGGCVTSGMCGAGNSCCVDAGSITAVGACSEGPACTTGLKRCQAPADCSVNGKQYGCCVLPQVGLGDCATSCKAGAVMLCDPADIIANGMICGGAPCIKQMCDDKVVTACENPACTWEGNGTGTGSGSGITGTGGGSGTGTGGGSRSGSGSGCTGQQQAQTCGIHCGVVDGCTCLPCPMGDRCVQSLCVPSTTGGSGSGTSIAGTGIGTSVGTSVGVGS